MSAQTTEPRLADDMIRGAKLIAEEIGSTPNVVYHLHRLRLLPTFAVGRILHARRSTLREHYAKLEAAALQHGGEAA
jgi:hypothetical protein